jgi:hypothetical protein
MARKKKTKVPPSIVVEEIETVIPVKVNPFLAPNGEVPAEDLIEPLNAILKECEEMLRVKSLEYNITDNEDLTFGSGRLPENFEYIPAVTRNNTGEDAFRLVDGKIAKLKYSQIVKDLYVDRIFLKPEELKELFKQPERAKKAIYKLISDMFENLKNIKKLDKSKRYYGNTLASIKRFGHVTGYCAVFSEDYEFLEIRLFSDATELV